MVMAWRVDFYQETDGSAPVEEFLESLSVNSRAKALAVIRTLEQEGPNLPFPYSSQVRGRLRELRTQYGKTRIRIIYFGDPRRVFILLHGIMKTTASLQEADIRTAEQRMTSHIRRLEGRD